MLRCCAMAELSNAGGFLSRCPITTRAWIRGKVRPPPWAEAMRRTAS